MTYFFSWVVCCSVHERLWFAPVPEINFITRGDNQYTIVWMERYWSDYTATTGSPNFTATLYSNKKHLKDPPNKEKTWRYPIKKKYVDYSEIFSNIYSIYRYLLDIYRIFTAFTHSLQVIIVNSIYWYIIPT